MISYNGYKTNCITIENGNAKVGDIVSIDSDGKIYKSTKNQPFIGVCVAVRGKYAVVQTDGYYEFRTVATTLNCGYRGFVAAGDNAIDIGDISVAGRTFLVLKYDGENKTVGIVL